MSKQGSYPGDSIVTLCVAICLRANHADRCRNGCHRSRAAVLGSTTLHVRVLYIVVRKFSDFGAWSEPGFPDWPPLCGGELKVDSTLPGLSGGLLNHFKTSFEVRLEPLGGYHDSRGARQSRRLVVAGHCGTGNEAGFGCTAARPDSEAALNRDGDSTDSEVRMPARSGLVRFISTRPKSRTMRATRQLMLPPSTVS